jgi:hypothetical protein
MANAATESLRETPIQQQQQQQKKNSTPDTAVVISSPAAAAAAGTPTTLLTDSGSQPHKQQEQQQVPFAVAGLDAHLWATQLDNDMAAVAAATEAAAAGIHASKPLSFWAHETGAGAFGQEANSLGNQAAAAWGAGEARQGQPCGTRVVGVNDDQPRLQQQLQMGATGSADMDSSPAGGSFEHQVVQQLTQWSDGMGSGGLRLKLDLSDDD